MSPNQQAYDNAVNTWTKPARNDYCTPDFPTCDPSSQTAGPVYQDQELTVDCYRPDGQRIITGTKQNPGYDDRRWVHLLDGRWLPNTWFVRHALRPDLPTC